MGCNPTKNFMGPIQPAKMPCPAATPPYQRIPWGPQSLTMFFVSWAPHLLSHHVPSRRAITISSNPPGNRRRIKGTCWHVDALWGIGTATFAKELRLAVSWQRGLRTAGDQSAGSICDVQFVSGAIRLSVPSAIRSWC